MKISLNWLHEWVKPAASAAQLAHKLNMAGLECEAEPLLAEVATGVVVGKILSAEKHPQADRLRVCQVDIGTGTRAQIVCGAANARAGLSAPAALPGATLPGGMQIKDAQLRGVASAGMLCSAKELGLAAQSDGLLELDDDAVPGTPIAAYLGLDDALLTLELTPNRGDALSIAGLARETAALYGCALTSPSTPAVAVSSARSVPVAVADFADCSAYTGRVVEGINPDARTPDWMREKLRRSGLRCIHPVVDITNYVMLELGQPLHAFDLAKLSGGITVRRAAAGEQCKLLTEETVTLRNELLITDTQKVLALAGVMGGFDSGVTAGTVDIFLESAAFAPQPVVGTARRHKLSSDAGYRFERGVDHSLHAQALERATALVLAICGGQAGPVSAAQQPKKAEQIPLSLKRLVRLIGVEYRAEEVVDLLERLGVQCTVQGEGEWLCTPPPWRYDLAIEQDLMEEVARLHGYEQIPARPYAAQLVPSVVTESRRAPQRIKDALVARGWQEAITYSFVDAKLQAKLLPDVAALALDNPIAETMGVMRTTLWTGLISAWMHNHARQSTRVRMFELAATFSIGAHGAVAQTQRLAGLAAGSSRPEQWGEPQRAVDFYDVKADLEALTAAFGGGAADYRFVPASHPALHPGRTAQLLRSDAVVGVLGELHPQLVADLGLPSSAILFELDWGILGTASLPKLAELSEFPASRRDIAVVVAESVSIGAMTLAIQTCGIRNLIEVRVFDVYRGKGLEQDCKSVAFGLIFQDLSRTLNLEEVDAAVLAVVQKLQKEHGAVLRN